VGKPQECAPENHGCVLNFGWIQSLSCRILLSH